MEGFQLNWAPLLLLIAQGKQTDFERIINKDRQFGVARERKVFKVLKGHQISSIFKCSSDRLSDMFLV